MIRVKAKVNTFLAMPIVFFLWANLSLAGVRRLPLELGHFPVNEQDFFHMLKQVEDTYAPLFKSQGLNFSIRKQWSVQTFNTDSTYDGTNFVIQIPGALARLPLMDVDSLALAACHEIGHYLGGAPKKRVMDGITWWSVEGQADYFATAKCLKRIFPNRPENRAAYRALPEAVKTEIKKVCRSFLCARIVTASLRLVKTVEYLQKEMPSVSLGKKETYVAPQFMTDHPSTQCRLDTFVAGATCSVSVDEDFDPYDLSAGACVRDALDPEEAKSARPACWFGPQLW